MNLRPLKKKRLKNQELLEYFKLLIIMSVRRVKKSSKEAAENFLMNKILFCLKMNKFKLKHLITFLKANLIKIA